MFAAAKISSPALRTGSAILICCLRAISSWAESDVLGIRPLSKIGTRVVRGENQAHTISGRSRWAYTNWLRLEKGACPPHVCTWPDAADFGVAASRLLSGGNQT